MSHSRWRPLGFLVAFVAMSAFVFHPNHLQVENGSETSSHCCVCHTVPMGVALPAAEYAPVAILTSGIVIPAQADPVSVPFSLASPRGPPVA